MYPMYLLFALDPLFTLSSAAFLSVCLEYFFYAGISLGIHKVMSYSKRFEHMLHNCCVHFI